MLTGVIPVFLARMLQQQTFPPLHHNISVVIMNHNRPQLLRDSNLLRTLSQHAAVQEILLLHSNPATAFGPGYLSVGSDKIQHRNATDANDKFGLSVRFHYCAMAESDWVLIVDDDMELEASALDQTVGLFARDSRRIVGRYGRTVARNGQYVLRNSYGNVEIVLTKFLLLERQVCTAFNQYRYLMDDITNHATPKWNGEDIYLNLVANHLYNVPSQGPYQNLAVKELPVWDSKIPSAYELSVSGNPTNSIFHLRQFFKRREQARRHQDDRTIIYQKGKERLAALVAQNTAIDSTSRLRSLDG